MKRITNILLFILIPIFAFSQNTGANDFFSNIGKIYVVVGVIMILFVSIVGFLFYIERRVAQLEQ